MRKLLHSILFCLAPFFGFSQYPTDLNNYVSQWSASKAFIDNDHDIHLEIPPWIIGGGWRTYLMVNGVKTFTYSTPDPIVGSQYVQCTDRGPYDAVGPEASKPWKRNYSSIYSAHYFTHPVYGTINIGFCHDENKNGCGSQNTINPTIPPTCAPGTDFSAYFAFVSAVWTPNVAATNWGQTGYNNDIGPILWPSVGYVTQDNLNATEGLLQPSSIISNGYIYIYIWDKGPKPNLQGEGKARGIKLVRTTIANSTNPSAYEVYYKDPQGNVQWLPSLPTGFTKETMLNYVKVEGPKSTDILTDEIALNTESFRFTAAAVNNTNYFIGLEEYIDNNDNGRHHLALRFSNDLINWSAREKVVETSTNWDASDMNYPIFLSADGWSNTAINLDDFYIMGTHSQSPFSNYVNLINVHVYTPPPPPPPTCPHGCNQRITADAVTLSSNPNHGIFQIRYHLNGNGLAQTQINIFDITGKMLSRASSGAKTAGFYQENIFLANKAKGIYVVELIVDGARTQKKVVVN